MVGQYWRYKFLPLNHQVAVFWVVRVGLWNLGWGWFMGKYLVGLSLDADSQNPDWWFCERFSVWRFKTYDPFALVHCGIIVGSGWTDAGFLLQAGDWCGDHVEEGGVLVLDDCTWAGKMKVCNDLPEAEPGFVVFLKRLWVWRSRRWSLALLPALRYSGFGMNECMVNVCKLLLNIDVVFRKLTSRGSHEGQRG